MSWSQLHNCRELERLAQELNFVLHPFQGEILLKCREIRPEDDPTGQTVIPYNSWLPFDDRSIVMHGSVSDLLMFLQGVQFMKTHVETHLGMRKQVEQVRQRQIQNLQQNATFQKLSE